MQLFLLTVLTMAAFAANSVLTRAAVVGGTDVASFGIIRLLSGAFLLVLICLVQNRRIEMLKLPRGLGAFGLLLYIAGFTGAYAGMESGQGALLLFGTVQVAMFAGAVMLRETIPAMRWLGSAVAFAGLVYLVWPWQGIADNQFSVAMMILAGLGWALYSLIGRGSHDPIADSAAHFAWAALALPIVALLFGLLPGELPNVSGIVLACVSGALTSALGYAIWYAILPKLGASLGAIAQLSVPPLALLGGMIFLGEALTLKFVISSAIILGGLLLAIRGPVWVRRRAS